MQHTNNEKLTARFISHLNRTPEYLQAREIVLANSQDGRAWLIGGFIFRTLANLLYKTPVPIVDLDFIIESPSPTLILPTDWQWRPNRFGNPKISGPNLAIDFVPLNNVYSIIERGLEPTIENFQSATPLDIQSIVFEIKSGRLSGDRGLTALANRTVSATCSEAARMYEHHYHQPINELISEKATQLNFKPIFLDWGL